MYVDDDNDDDK